MDLSTDLIYKAVYELAERANVSLPREVYEKLQAYNCECSLAPKTTADIMKQILQNAYLARKNRRPLCQDCGQVVVFLRLGQGVRLVGEYIEDVINRAVEDCYRDKFYRKSVVKDALERENTGTNTPAIIHTQIVEGDEVEILLALKGGGAENTSQVKMFNPTATKEEIFEFVKKVAFDAGENACPPMILGVGMGGTIEKVCLLAKLALYKGVSADVKIENVLETRVLSTSTHIASLPVCVNINCHSARHAECKIVDSAIVFEDNNYEILPVAAKSTAQEVFTGEIDKIKALKSGEKILLTGTIYTARDAAHKRIAEGVKLPFSLKDAIIFYAGPCPPRPNEVIGPIGPTTAKRMDKFAPILYEHGVLATIGKGDRNAKGVYFKAAGGVASYLQNCVKTCELTAFEDLGAEAIYKLEVEKLPLTRA